MGRFIDADKFFEDFKNISFMNIEGHPMVAGSVVLMLLDKQPTAYDVDAVVKELESHLTGWMPIQPIDKASEIVRKGGVE